MAEEKTVKIPLALKGLDQRSEPINLEGTSPDMKNVYIDGDKIRKRLGYNRLGSGAAMSGVGQQIIKWTDSRGTNHYIALTTTKAYKYNSGTDAWDDITPTAGDFTGSASDRWSFTTAHDGTKFSNNGGSALVISNGVDLPHYFEGQTGDEFQELSEGNYPNTLNNTNEVLEYWNHLFYLNYNDTATGVQNVKSFIYADLADVDDWVDGTSGGGVLTDSIGEILRALKIGNEVAIYSEQSITKCVYVGGDTLYAFPTVVFDTGLLANRAVCKASRRHYFIGDDNRVYEYQSSQPYSISLLVEDSLFDDIDLSKKGAIVLGHDKNNHRVYIFYPTSSDTYATSYYCVDYRNNSWEYGRLADTVRGCCQYDDCMLFITHDGYVYKFDNSGGQDDTSNIDAYYHTPDITIDAEENYFRLSMFTLNIKSSLSDSTIEVDYSTDGGNSWTEMKSAYSISTNWAHYRIPVDIVDRRCRFRISQNSAKDFQIRSMHCTLEYQTDR